MPAPPQGGDHVCGFTNYPLPHAFAADDNGASASTKTPTEIVFLDSNNPYSAPSGNPVVKGALLSVASTLVARLPLLSSLLYSNAGFGQLRRIRQLDTVGPQYDPTVVPEVGAARFDAESDECEYLGHAAVADDRAADSAKAKERPAPAHGFRTIADFHQAYKSGEFTPTDAAEAILEVIADNGGPLRKAFIHIRPDLVRQAASDSTERWKKNKPLSELDGVPFAVKDEFDVKGYPKTLGTRMDLPSMCESESEKESSWLVQKLTEKGAVMVGITNMHEMGVDTCNCNPHYGTPPNPYAPGLIYPGGSSGGSASVVGTGLVPFALGADGGGSIRVPSVFCGVYGLKTSHGRVSKRPTAPFASTTGVAGPIAGTVTDLAKVYALTSQWDSHGGKDRFPLTVPRSVVAGKRRSNNRYVLGVYRPWFDSAEKVVREAAYRAISQLESTGLYTVKDIQIPLIQAGASSHAITILNELLNAFDTTLRSSEGLEPSSYRLAGDLVQIGEENVAPATRVLLQVARASPASDFLLAQRVRNAIMQHLSSLFRDAAEPEGPSRLIIVTPTVPITHWPIGPGEEAYGVTNADMSLRVMRYVWLANFSGCPAVSCPVGYEPVPVPGRGGPAASPVVDGDSTRPDLAPLGLMGMAEWGNEAGLLEFAADVDRLVGACSKAAAESSSGFSEDGAAGRDRPRAKLWVDVFQRARARRESRE